MMLRGDQKERLRVIAAYEGKHLGELVREIVDDWLAGKGQRRETRYR